MKRLIVICVAAAALGGCTDSGASTGTTVAPVVTTAVEDTSAAQTTTSSSATTTSTAPATSTTTTPPETTTTVATEDLIKQAVQDYSLAYHQCGVSPAQCDPRTFTAVEGPSRAIITKFATDMQDQGLYFSPVTRGSYVVAESVDVVSATEASAIFCVYDAGTVIGPDGPDGQPTIVNDQVLSFRDEYHLYRAADSWLVGEKHELEQLGEGNRCPSAA